MKLLKHSWLVQGAVVLLVLLLLMYLVLLVLIPSSMVSSLVDSLDAMLSIIQISIMMLLIRWY